VSIAGIGADITSIARVQALLRRFPERFPLRILTPSEREAWAQRGSTAAWLAKRFAAKEALSKALGTGIGARVGFQDLLLGSTPGGAPMASFQGAALDLARSRGINAVHVTLSDEGDMALAFVVLESA